MSYAIAAESGWNVLLSQGGFGPSPRDPLNPYASLGGSGVTQPPPRRSSALWWVLGIGGGVVLLLCCGCGVAGYFSFTGVMGFMEGMVKEQFKDDPVIVEHIGEIKTVKTNFTATGEEKQRNPQPGRNVLVFDVTGTKGSGQIVGTQVQAPEQGLILENARLRKNGQEFPLSK
ncbi:MAG TPA: hypothetical protein VFB96_17095 [Pirellulaceae bacterium]|jgi:hypothetical protein|nr:hypothetical protein [Pirellulaceae bacterium]